MEKKFSLHKLWFFYTDEWIVENGLAQSIGTFATREEAEREKKRLDRESLKKMHSYDLIRDLTSFYEKNYQEVQDKLIDYAKSQGWDDSLKQHSFGNDPAKFYYELALPATATDEQLDRIMDITGASFHKLIEYKDVKEYAYVKMNYEFWGKKVFDKLKADGILDSRSPYLNGGSNKGFYLIDTPPKGRKTAKFSSPETAVNMAIKIFLECVAAFPDNNFLGKTYVGEWSEAYTLLMAYLQYCSTIRLQATEVTKDNLKSFKAKLKKLKSTTELTEGMQYFDVAFSEAAATSPEEILGLIELLKLEPFTIYNMIAEIDGQTVKDYVADSSTM
ncbi:hypothetical protein A4D02_24365 [Niastella koreensis]|uniref:Uncharacterized protein n=2 Tax=Niastella koreensis TaxID=354356 RepID=G8TDL7_NIAKG|nr:hypothetical protein [Niastella koreensis]AEW00467.1 hypothetical protein Niako_4193 [Niastella koreensis GR20-10]OQP52331.1 hypothetical protein A4D02_24365 [Niastella koreensis]